MSSPDFEGRAVHAMDIVKVVLPAIDGAQFTTIATALGTVLGALVAVMPQEQKAKALQAVNIAISGSLARHEAVQGDGDVQIHTARLH